MQTKNILIWVIAILILAIQPVLADSLIAGDAAAFFKANSLNIIKPAEVSSAMKIVVLLTMLSIVPTLLIATTSFLRIIIVLSMLRHAIGMQDTPPNAALISIAIFLTIFSMQPVWSEINQNAWAPFQANKVSMEEAFDRGVSPMREFMIRQTREKDLSLMVDLSGAERPETMNEIDTTQLIPAFMLSELRSAFQIGFMIFLPFLLIDLVVASILTSLGMMMVPPITISLPLKILMFILIDGWNLVVKSLMSSFS
ncbi:flagellar biosynthetic protein FliP [Methylophilaceae bacterium 11]|nr:flagellar biosynthetic protein FliP [Methylophilaceae bacterium 11]